MNSSFSFYLIFMSTEFRNSIGNPVDAQNAFKKEYDDNRADPESTRLFRKGFDKIGQCNKANLTLQSIGDLIDTTSTVINAKFELPPEVYSMLIQCNYKNGTKFYLVPGGYIARWVNKYSGAIILQYDEFNEITDPTVKARFAFIDEYPYFHSEVMGTRLFPRDFKKIDECNKANLSLYTVGDIFDTASLVKNRTFPHSPNVYSMLIQCNFKNGVKFYLVPGGYIARWADKYSGSIIAQYNTI